MRAMENMDIRRAGTPGEKVAAYIAFREFWNNYVKRGVPAQKRDP